MFINLHTHSTLRSTDTKNIENIIIGEPGSDIEIIEQNLLAINAYSVGIHPWYIDAETIDKMLGTTEYLATKSQVKAIGEIGLDKLKGPDFKIQETVFIAQIRIAERLNKPIIVHSVKSFNELIAIQKIIRPKVPMIIHGYKQKKEVANELLKKGFFLSVGDAILKDTNMEEVLRHIPLNQLFFETDTSNISIEEIYAKASEILSLPLETIKETIYENYLSIFI